MATGGIPEPTGLLSNPINVEMEILDEDYEGDIYLYIEYESRFFVGNLVFTTEDDGTTPSPTPEPTPTPEKTATPIKTSKTTQVPSGTSSEGNYQIYIYIAVAVIVIIGAGVIFIIWKKK